MIDSFTFTEPGGSELGGGRDDYLITTQVDSFKVTDVSILSIKIFRLINLLTENNIEH